MIVGGIPQPTAGEDSVVGYAATRNRPAECPGSVELIGDHSGNPYDWIVTRVTRNAKAAEGSSIPMER